MKGTRHSEEQIIAILKQGEAGLTTSELCRQQGITEQTYYRWKAKHVGISRLRGLNVAQLRDLDKTLVIQDNDKPLAVLLKYEHFLAMQERIKDGE